VLGSPAGASGRVISLDPAAAPWTLDAATGRVRRSVNGHEPE
jgi:hypothetical protein